MVNGRRTGDPVACSVVSGSVGLVNCGLAEGTGTGLPPQTLRRSGPEDEAGGVAAHDQHHIGGQRGNWSLYTGHFRVFLRIPEDQPEVHRSKKDAYQGSKVAWDENRKPLLPVVLNGVLVVGGAWAAGGTGMAQPTQRGNSLSSRWGFSPRRSPRCSPACRARGGQGLTPKPRHTVALPTTPWYP